MARFRKKPIVIDAFRWRGGNVAELTQWAAGADHKAKTRLGAKLTTDVSLPLHVTTGDNRVEIDTLEGTMYAAPGDWIICGVKGEFYSCKPDIFEATYERME